MSRTQLLSGIKARLDDIVIAPQRILCAAISQNGGPRGFGKTLAQDYVALDTSDPKKADYELRILALLMKLQNTFAAEGPKDSGDPMSLSIHAALASFFDSLGGYEAFGDSIGSRFCGEDAMDAGSATRVKMGLGLLSAMQQLGGDEELDEGALPIMDDMPLPEPSNAS